VLGAQPAVCLKVLCELNRDIGMLADQEIEHRLASTVSGLRRGIASARSLHASLRSEAKSLEDFIPMLVEGARSGITSLLKHQASSLSVAQSRVSAGCHAVDADQVS